MSAPLAGPPGECCRQTVLHAGEARGTIETVAGVETYVARPADGSNGKIALFFGDIYGPMYINSKLIMDFWADNGAFSGARTYRGRVMNGDGCRVPRSRPRLLRGRLDDRASRWQDVVRLPWLDQG